MQGQKEQRRGFWDRHFWKFALAGLLAFFIVCWMSLPPAPPPPPKPADYGAPYQPSPSQASSSSPSGRY